ncbi:hypothetical protein EDD65_1211 [Keratinibaculum paraultunense]|jgi:hypothetical protein|uniref:Uncharacterized protein n=1 Tax=Keratinibaculum paraultunense TaxID=1278232 RepID=A0A4R3KNZ6_9FIRM|nr:zf-TFIIB domain-containing protein [Keratinibaculum paraultunense]QQY79051.1 hypothetical protein JL105_07600 [Keratinibaculum paraultunense]TCS85546.1 hypothetical protein EDD65_1211 [Keratinibaculum paraultunense]
MPCLRCGGSGVLAQYSHVAGGVCFRCGGSGIDPNELKLNKSKRRIEKVKIVNGRKIVLEPKYDLQGRFSHYSVYVEGKYEATYKKYKDANNAFRKFIEQEQKEKNLKKQLDDFNYIQNHI